MDKTIPIVKSISDKNRLRIFSALLSYDELCACQITEFLGVAGATASRHLGLMVNAGVLKNRKQGRWIYFRINTDNPSLTPLFNWVKDRIKKSEQVEKDVKALKKILLIPREELSQKQRESGTCKIQKERKTDNERKT